MIDANEREWGTNRGECSTRINANKKREWKTRVNAIKEKTVLIKIFVMQNLRWYQLININCYYY